MQMWTLGRFLPLAVSHLIPPGNENWENFLRLLEIMDIVFSHVIPQDQVGYLESLISDHHLCFKGLYPGASITLKMHSLVPYSKAHSKVHRGTMNCTPLLSNKNLLSRH